MMDSQSLKHQWESFNAKESFKQLSVIGTTKWFYGYQNTGNKTLLIISNIPIKTLKSSDEILIVTRYRGLDNKYTLTLELQDIKYEDVFYSLCSDLYNYSQQFNSKSEKIIIAQLSKRYSEWNRLFKGKKSDLLDASRIKGLIGELLFLELLLNTNKDHLSIIQGWTGPDRKDQDFIFADNWYEVKAVKLDADSVKISSLEQLLPESDGFLIVQKIEECNPNKTEGFSLNDLVYRIKDLLVNEEEALLLFEAKLLQAGYVNLSDYSLLKYSLEGSDHYCINDSFPRLTNQVVPSQVIRCMYELSLSAIAPWKTENLK